MVVGWKVVRQILYRCCCYRRHLLSWVRHFCLIRISPQRLRLTHIVLLFPVLRDRPSYPLLYCLHTFVRHDPFNPSCNDKLWLHTFQYLISFLRHRSHSVQTNAVVSEGRNLFRYLKKLNFCFLYVLFYW